MFRVVKIGIVSVALAGILGCTENDVTSIAVASSAPPPVSIDVAQVKSMEVTDWNTYTSRLNAPEHVSLHSRVTGIIDQILFEEGSVVKKGDILFKLDDRTFKAEVDSLQAQLARAEAGLRQAASEYKRAQSLSASRSISAEETEARRAMYDQREAEVTSIKASLNIALLNLEFSTIRSPINGKVSFAELTVGNTVRANDTILTSIVASKTVEAYFEIDERTWNAKFVGQQDVLGLPVQLSLNGSESAQGIYGKVDFVDNHINPNTGTIKVRAVFDNANQTLIPGSFARISIAARSVSEHIIVPDRAIGTDLKNRFVLVVDKDNKLTYRPVSIGKRLGEFRIINSGLSNQDKIATNGPAKVGPGMSITPRMVELELPKKLLVSEFVKQIKNNQAITVPNADSNLMGAK